LIPALGYAVSVACLIWVYRGFDFQRELPKLRSTHWGWVTLAVATDICVYVCQGWRWSTLLRPLAETSPWKTTQAIYIGLFANEILPLRSGEIIRCYLQRRWTGLPLAVVLSSVIIERLLDGLWLILGFLAVSQFVDLPSWMEGIAQVLLLILVAGSSLVGLSMIYWKRAHSMVASSRWAKLLQSVVDGIHLMGDRRTLALAALLSSLYLALQVLPIYFLMRGYGLGLSPWAAAAVLVILRTGTILPNAPGNVGTFQALAIAGLGLFGLDRSDATGFATFLFLVVTVPLLLAGFVALLATKMRLTEIHRDAHETFTGGH
jgi:uncharacterized protein (TIRG00374 family)